MVVLVYISILIRTSLVGAVSVGPVLLKSNILLITRYYRILLQLYITSV